MALDLIDRWGSNTVLSQFDNDGNSIIRQVTAVIIKGTQFRHNMMNIEKYGSFSTKRFSSNSDVMGSDYVAYISYVSDDFTVKQNDTMTYKGIELRVVDWVEFSLKERTVFYKIFLKS